MLLQIFWHLDGPSLEAAAVACKRWRAFIVGAVAREKIKVRRTARVGTLLQKYWDMSP